MGIFPTPKLDSHGDSWAPAYDHGRPPISSYNKGDTWAPKQETHADLSSKLDSHADTWAPAFNIGDTPTPKLEGHEHFPAPKLEAHGETI